MTQPEKTYRQILLELSRTRAFAHLGQDKLENIASLAKIRNFPKGGTILAEGSRNHDLYFLLKGSVTVYSGGRKVTRYGRAGDIFGEMSVVAAAPVSATVIANEDVETIMVDGRYVGGFHSHLDHEMVTVFYKLFSLSLLEKLKLTTLKARLFEDAVRHLPADLQHGGVPLPEKTVEKNLTDTLLTSLAVYWADQAIVVADGEGRIVRFNLAAENLFSRIELQVAGTHIYTLCEKGEQTPIFPQMLAGEISAWNGELDFVTALGRVFPARTSISVIQDHEGQKIGMLTIITDLSGQKKLERELRDAQQRDAVGQLAAGVAHDFNNLLQIISGNAALALATLPKKGRGRPELQRVLEAAELGSQLTHFLLSAGRHHHLHRVPMDPGVSMANLAGVLARVMEPHLELRVESAARLWRVNGDPALLEQMLMNLCVNAREAMPEGGVMTLKTANVALNRAFCATNRWARPGEFVMVAVHDTGLAGAGQRPAAGAAADRAGTRDRPGLGLSVALGIVKQHEGFVHVEGAAHTGTTVAVYLPRETRRSKPGASRPQGQPVGGEETILVAEDEPGVQQLVAQILHGAGYRVLTASDGEEALKVFEAHADQVDLVLLDAIMPKKSGVEVYQALKKKNPGLRVLVTSGYSRDVINAGFLQENRIPLVAKPFKAEGLLAEVRRLLDQPGPQEK